jgi:hypothetical protein
MNIAEMAPPQVTGGALASTLIGTWLARFFGYLPTAWGYIPATLAAIGSVLAIVWYMLMIWESDTFKEWRNRRATKSKMRKIARLQARVKMYQAELEALDVKREAEVVATTKIADAKVAAAKTLAQTEMAVSEIDKK